MCRLVDDRQARDRTTIAGDVLADLRALLGLPPLIALISLNLNKINKRIAEQIQSANDVGQSWLGLLVNCVSKRSHLKNENLRQ